MEMSIEQSSLFRQLAHDYPDQHFSFSPDQNHLIVNGRALYLAFRLDELIRVDIFSPAGKNYYQALVHLLYDRLGLEPCPKSLADLLLPRKEEADAYRIRKIASGMGLAFLEGDQEGDVLAVEVDDGRDADLLQISYEEEEEDLEELEGADE